MAYTVGQLSRLTELTVRALHHYDAIGLLSPSHRSDAGYRLYTQGDVVRLFRVQALQRLGLPLAEIRLALTENGEALPHIITRQIDELDANIDHATALRERLARLRDLLAAGSDPATEDWLSALALVSQYDRLCSAPELAKLVANSRATVDQWPRLVEDIRSAMQAGISRAPSRNPSCAARSTVRRLLRPRAPLWSQEPACCASVLPRQKLGVGSVSWRGSVVNVKRTPYPAGRSCSGSREWRRRS
jgi:DNA-binding transcriptional MerR regulator